MVHNVSQDYYITRSFFCEGVSIFFFFLLGIHLGEVSVDRISKGARMDRAPAPVWKLARKTAGRKQTIRKKRYPTQDQVSLERR